MNINKKFEECKNMRLLQLYKFDDKSFLNQKNVLRASLLLELLISMLVSDSTTISRLKYKLLKDIETTLFSKPKTMKLIFFIQS